MLFRSALALGLLPELIAAYNIAHRRDIQCSYSMTASGGETCVSFAEPFSTSVDEFKNLNPGVRCDNMAAGEYCLIGSITDDEPTTTSRIVSTTTSSAPNTPTQSGIAKNCDRFHKINGGAQCNTIEAAYGISHAQFLQWNPAINSACSNLLVGYYVCVHIPGAKPPPTTTTTSKTPEQTCYKYKPDSVQPGAVCGCDKWHVVKDEKTTCNAIIAYEKINEDDFYRWNPKIGGRACSGLWKGYSVCVHGPNAHAPVTTTSKKPKPTCHPGAPDPVQPGAVCNCDGWHQVKDSSTTCDGIVKYENIYASDFYKWNPNIGGSKCNGLWKGYWVCTHVPGAKRPPSQPACRPGAPEPVQPGATCKCKKWHKVKDSSTTCEGIIKYDHIKASDFYKWNPKIGGSKCNGLWKGYYVCVGV